MWQAVALNEVGGNTAVACSIHPPIGGSGSSGWTIGYIQQDFNTNSTGAQATLTDALVASGQFSQSTAQSIGQALTNAGTSNNVTLPAGVTINSINQALQTPGAANSIYQSGQDAFASSVTTLNTNVLQNSELTPAVKDALADPTTGPLIATFLADYSNQYGNISANGPMMTLLTSDSAKIGGQTMNINTTNNATVAQSILSVAMDTKWASGSTANGTPDAEIACNRIANDVAAADAYASSQGSPVVSSITLNSDNGNGTCSINSSANGVSFTGQWTGGSISGSATSVSEISVTTINQSNGTSVQDTFNSTAPVQDQVTDFSSTNGTGKTVSVTDYLAPTMPGKTDTVDVSNATLIAGSLTNAVISGSGDNFIAQGTDNTVTITGNNDVVNSTNSGNTFDLCGTGDSGSVTGDTLNLAANSSGTFSGSSDTLNADGTGISITDTGSSNVVNSSYSGDSFTMDGSGDSYSGLAGGESSGSGGEYGGGDSGGGYSGGGDSGGGDSGGGYSGGGGDYGGCGGGGDDGDPIVLNLQGQRVQTVGLMDSSAYFDMQNNGQKVQTQWVTPGEGLLVYDPSDTGTVTEDANLVGGFGQLNALAQTVDGTSGGVLNSSDALWNSLKVWVDPTGSGVFNSADLYTLSQLGITSINLNTTAASGQDNSSGVVADSEFTMANGSTGDIAGVNFEFNPNAVQGQSNDRASSQLKSGDHHGSLLPILRAPGHAIDLQDFTAHSVQGQTNSHESSQLNNLIAAMSTFSPPDAVETNYWNQNQALPEHILASGVH
jgi:hypothetical protein